MYLVDLVTFQVINSSAIREPQVPIMGSYFDNNVFVATFYTSTGLLIRVNFRQFQLFYCIKNNPIFLASDFSVFSKVFLSFSERIDFKHWNY